MAAQPITCWDFLLGYRKTHDMRKMFREKLRVTTSQSYTARIFKWTPCKGSDSSLRVVMSHKHTHTLCTKYLPGHQSCYALCQSLKFLSKQNTLYSLQYHLLNCRCLHPPVSFFSIHRELILYFIITLSF